MLTQNTNQRAQVALSRPTFFHILFAWLGSSIAIATVALLSQYSGQPLILGSSGASCVLLFGFPEAQFSQSRNLVFGHLLCSVIGLLFFHYLGHEWWSLSLAVSTALVVMMLTKTVHPPAGSNPVIIFLTHPDWQFLLFPTLAGALILFLLSKVYRLLIRYGQGTWQL